MSEWDTYIERTFGYPEGAKAGRQRVIRAALTDLLNSHIPERIERARRDVRLATFSELVEVVKEFDKDDKAMIILHLCESEEQS